MANRMIRESVLDSGRYWAVTIEARQLVWHLMLLADDFGCVSLAPAFVRRRCFDDSPSGDKINQLIQQLFDADLVRIYDQDGARYGFIPRFKQRLKRMTLKHPEPPSTILEGDEDAREKFRQIRDKTKNPAPDGGPKAAGGRPEVEVEVEGKSLSAVVRPIKGTGSASPTFLAAWEVYPRRTGGNPKDAAWKKWQARLADGHSEEEMLAGVRRYAAFARATGKEGTEYVQQAVRFFGREKSFLESWACDGTRSAGQKLSAGKRLSV